VDILVEYQSNKPLFKGLAQFGTEGASDLQPLVSSYGDANNSGS
jgi:hypothetical protein